MSTFDNLLMSSRFDPTIMWLFGRGGGVIRNSSGEPRRGGTWYSIAAAYLIEGG